MQNIQEHNLECTHLFSEKFSMKQYVSQISKKIIKSVLICFPKDSLSNNTYKNFEEENRECIHLFYERFFIKEYISKILKKIMKSVFICFPKDSL